MNKQLCALRNGAVIIPKLINLKIIMMDISEYSQFRPAIQSKDFEKERQEFVKQCNSFFAFIEEAMKEDRVFKLSRKNPIAPLVMLPEDNPAQDELKNNFAEITFVVKLK